MKTIFELINFKLYKQNMILDQVRPIVHKSCQEVTIVGGGDWSIFAAQISPRIKRKLRFLIFSHTNRTPAKVYTSHLSE